MATTTEKTGSLKTWTHPKTGAARIYVNSESFDRGVKVYLEGGPSADTYQIRCFADFRIDRAYHEDVATKIVIEHFGDCDPLFVEMVEACR